MGSQGPELHLPHPCPAEAEPPLEQVSLAWGSTARSPGSRDRRALGTGTGTSARSDLFQLACTFELVFHLCGTDPWHGGQWLWPGLVRSFFFFLLFFGWRLAVTPSRTLALLCHGRPNPQFRNSRAFPPCFDKLPHDAEVRVGHDGVRGAVPRRCSSTRGTGRPTPGSASGGATAPSWATRVTAHQRHLSDYECSHGFFKYNRTCSTLMARSSFFGPTRCIPCALIDEMSKRALDGHDDSRCNGARDRHRESRRLRRPPQPKGAPLPRFTACSANLAF